MNHVVCVWTVQSNIALHIASAATDVSQAVMMLMTLALTESGSYGREDLVPDMLNECFHIPILHVGETILSLLCLCSNLTLEAPLQTASSLALPPASSLIFELAIGANITLAGFTIQAASPTANTPPNATHYTHGWTWSDQGTVIHGIFGTVMPYIIAFSRQVSQAPCPPAASYLLLKDLVVNYTACGMDWVTIATDISKPIGVRILDIALISSTLSRCCHAWQHNLAAAAIDRTLQDVYEQLHMQASEFWDCHPSHVQRVETPESCAHLSVLCLRSPKEVCLCRQPSPHLASSNS